MYFVYQLQLYNFIPMLSIAYTWPNDRLKKKISPIWVEVITAYDKQIQPTKKVISVRSFERPYAHTHTHTYVSIHSESKIERKFEKLSAQTRYTHTAVYQTEWYTDEKEELVKIV